MTEHPNAGRKAVARAIHAAMWADGDDHEACIPASDDYAAADAVLALLPALAAGPPDTATEGRDSRCRRGHLLRFTSPLAYAGPCCCGPDGDGEEPDCRPCCPTDGELSPAPAPPGGDDTETFTRVPMRPMTDAEEAADVWDEPVPGGDDGAAGEEASPPHWYLPGEKAAWRQGRDAALAEAARARAEVERLTYFRDETERQYQRAMEQVNAEYSRADAAEAESARLAAALGRVDALCAQAEPRHDQYEFAQTILRAALADAGTNEGQGQS